MSFPVGGRAAVCQGDACALPVAFSFSPPAETMSVRSILSTIRAADRALPRFSECAECARLLAREKEVIRS